MENIVSKICSTIVCVALLFCLYKCSTIPMNDKKIHGYYYDIIKLNDSTYLLNPTYNSLRKTQPKIVTKDSIGFYIDEQPKH